MNVEHPGLLATCVAAAAVLIWAYSRAERLKTEHDLAYADVAFFMRAARPNPFVPRALRVAFAAALFAFALAASGLSLVLPVPVRDGSAMICIDTSGSMQSTDVSPTRADAAKAAARAFIDASPAGIRIGLIAFSGGASVLQGPTADRERLYEALDELPAPNGATAIGDALQLAAEALPQTGHRVAILVTDGVSNTGVDPDAAASGLAAKRIAVYTVGIGTPNGDVIGGEQATIDESALERYAETTGGSYARAENAAQLREALARLGTGTELERKRVAAAPALATLGACLLAGVTIAGLALGRFS